MLNSFLWRRSGKEEKLAEQFWKIGPLQAWRVPSMRKIRKSPDPDPSQGLAGSSGAEGLRRHPVSMSLRRSHARVCIKSLTCPIFPKRSTCPLPASWGSSWRSRCCGLSRWSAAPRRPPSLAPSTGDPAAKRRLMSDFGPKRTREIGCAMSAQRGEADSHSRIAQVRALGVTTAERLAAADDCRVLPARIQRARMACARGARGRE